MPRRASGGDRHLRRIGGGVNGAVGALTISGGSVTVAGFVANARVGVVLRSRGTRDPTYGVDDIFADDEGKVYLWLPDGSYEIEGNGKVFEATVDGAATEASLIGARPVIEDVSVVDGMFRITVANPTAGATYEIWSAESLTEAFSSAGVSATAADETEPLVLEIPLGAHASRFFKVAVCRNE